MPTALVCGCEASTDCPAGEACDTTTHACGLTCGGSGFTACNGGCCGSGGQCVAGTGNGACGATGGTCAVCAGATPTCGPSWTCTSACGQSGDGACGAGDCCVGNTCVADTSGLACGPSCKSCSGNAAGSGCVNGACGCTGAADCPVGQACDLGKNVCVGLCGTANYSPCHGGCCDHPVTGGQPTCVGGTVISACGSGGGACGACGAATCCVGQACVGDTVSQGCGPNCTDCTGNTNGSACIGGGCGCNVATDCPSSPPRACYPSKHQCSTTCGSGFTTCNGGCCDPGSGLAAPLCVVTCSSG
ncbi:MAG: hypothetical protein ACRELB_02635, partial [Polyangiaceae bacterium]